MAVLSVDNSGEIQVGAYAEASGDGYVSADAFAAGVIQVFSGFGATTVTQTGQGQVTAIVNNSGHIDVVASATAANGDTNLAYADAVGISIGANADPYDAAVLNLDVVNSGSSIRVFASASADRPWYCRGLCGRHFCQRRRRQRFNRHLGLIQGYGRCRGRWCCMPPAPTHRRRRRSRGSLRDRYRHRSRGPSRDTSTSTAARSFAVASGSHGGGLRHPCGGPYNPPAYTTPATATGYTTGYCSLAVSGYGHRNDKHRRRHQSGPAFPRWRFELRPRHAIDVASAPIRW